MEEKKTVMTQAWTIARTAKAKFGGKVREYIGAALRMAWKVAKTPIIVAKGISCCRGTELIDEAVVRTEVHCGWAKGWLARIELSGAGARYDLDRTFINTGDAQLSRAGNGKITYDLTDLADGIYEADSVYRSYTGFRAYFRVVAGSVVEIFDSKKAAKEALA